MRAVQLLLGHTKIESTVRYLGVEVDDTIVRSRRKSTSEVPGQSRRALPDHEGRRWAKSGCADCSPQAIDPPRRDAYAQHYLLSQWAGVDPFVMNRACSTRRSKGSRRTHQPLRNALKERSKQRLVCFWLRGYVPCQTLSEITFEVPNHAGNCCSGPLQPQRPVRSVCDR